MKIITYKKNKLLCKFFWRTFYSFVYNLLLISNIYIFVLQLIKFRVELELHWPLLEGNVYIVTFSWGLEFDHVGS